MMSTHTHRVATTPMVVTPCAVRFADPGALRGFLQSLESVDAIEAVAVLN